MGIFAIAEVRLRRPNPRTRAGLSEATAAGAAAALRGSGGGPRLGVGVRRGVCSRRAASSRGTVSRSRRPWTALSTTYRMVRGADPDHRGHRALALGWSEATLGYLHRLSCADPLTGLASMAHVRGRLAELYRGRRRDRCRVRDTHALVVVDAAGDPRHRPGRPDPGRAGAAGQPGRRGRAHGVRRRARRSAASARPEVVVLRARDDRLGPRVAVLRQLLVGIDRERATRPGLDRGRCPTRTRRRRPCSTSSPG